jgi:hypothetical protein
LLGRAGTFFQLLEGDKEKVLATFQKIATSEKPEKDKLLALLRHFSNTLPSSARDILAQTPTPNKAA